MDDEHQITIGINKDLWPKLQIMANILAKQHGWLSAKGNDRDYLNILVISLLASRPKEIEPWQWITKTLNDVES
jgi:hypothetical protein